MLPPDPATFNVSSYAAASLTYSRNCTVFYYNNFETMNISSITITFSDASGSSISASATPLHTIYKATSAVPHGSLVQSLPAGKACLMQEIRVGDLIAIHGPGGFYTTAITSVTNSTQTGAFSPFLLGAGLPIVYNSLFYAYATDSVLASFGLQYNALVHMQLVTQWKAAEASLALGCLAKQPAGVMPRNASACPCLDEQSPCIRMGAPLTSVPLGVNPMDISIAALWMEVALRTPAIALHLGLVISTSLAAIQVAIASGQTFTLASMTALLQRNWASLTAASGHRRSLLQAESGTYATGRGFYGVFWCAAQRWRPGYRSGSEGRGSTVV